MSPPRFDGISVGKQRNKYLVNFLFKLIVQQTSNSSQRAKNPGESYGAVRYNQPGSTSQRQCGFREGPLRNVYFHYQKRSAIYPEESE